MDVFATPPSPPPPSNPSCGFVCDATNRIIDPHFEQTPRHQAAIKTERGRKG